MRVGRNVEELLRVLDALQVSDAEEVGIPSGWASGDPILVPDGMTDSVAHNHFAGRLTCIRPHLRVVAPLQ
jgi:thioredoxin-dependent peroxiredoxin